MTADRDDLRDRVADIEHETAITLKDLLLRDADPDDLSIDDAPEER